MAVSVSLSLSPSSLSVGSTAVEGTVVVSNSDMVDRRVVGFRTAQPERGTPYLDHGMSIVVPAGESVEFRFPLRFSKDILTSSSDNQSHQVLVEMDNGRFYDASDTVLIGAG